MLLVQAITDFNLLGPTELLIYAISLTMVFRLRRQPAFIKLLPKIMLNLTLLSLIKFGYQAIVYLPDRLYGRIPWIYPLSMGFAWLQGSYLLYLVGAIISYPYFRQLKALLFEPVDNGYQAMVKEAVFATLVVLFVLILFYNPALSRRPPIIAFIGHALAALPLTYLYRAMDDWSKQFLLGLSGEDLLYRKQPDDDPNEI